MFASAGCGERNLAVFVFDRNPKVRVLVSSRSEYDCSTTHLIQTPTFSIVTHFWMIRVIVINFYSTASLDFMIVLGLFRIFFE